MLLTLDIGRPAVPVFLSPQAESFQLMNAPERHLGPPSVGLLNARNRDPALVEELVMNEKHGCSCARHLAQGFARQSINAGEGEIYQISLMSALIDGVYEGETTIAELLKHGNFGLGTFNHLDGELIAFDQEIHQLRADGSARPACLQQKTPSPSSPFSSPASASNSTGRSPRHSCTSASTNRSPRRTCSARCGWTVSSAMSKPAPYRVRNGLTAQCWKR